MTQDDILNIVAKAIVEEVNTDNPQSWRENNTTAFFVAMRAARYAAIEMAKQKDEEFEWKSITEIPTEHWDKNPVISPRYLVKCNGTTYDGLPVISYSSYSFAVNKWMHCFNAVEPGIWEVIAWTDVKL